LALGALVVRHPFRVHLFIMLVVVVVVQAMVIQTQTRLSLLVVLGEVVKAGMELVAQPVEQLIQAAAVVVVATLQMVKVAPVLSSSVICINKVNNGSFCPA
jgi:hypothetical protein